MCMMPQHHIKLDTGAHACHPSTKEVESGGQKVHGHLWLRASLKPAWDT